MKQLLTAEHLHQEVTVKLPLGALLRLGIDRPAPEAPRFTKDGPAIGERGMYGIYAGIARGYDGEPDAILEVLDEAPDPLSWEDAKKWAESIGGRLPTRKEQALLFANVPELFKEKAYWSCEQYADVSAYAWTQSFSYGLQFHWHKGDELMARAVRRLSI